MNIRTGLLALTGSILFQLNAISQDTNFFVFLLPDSHGETSEQVALLDADGKVLWRKVSDHCQFALIGRFWPDLPGKQVCFVDRQIYRYPPGEPHGQGLPLHEGGREALESTDEHGRHRRRAPH